MSVPLRLLLRLLVTIALVAAMEAFLPQYVLVTGGLPAFIVIGAILFVLNLVVRPALNVIALPLKLLFSLVALIAVNGAFVWLLTKVMERVDPALAQFHILGGWQGWVVVAVIVGVAHWLMKTLLK